MCRTQRCRSNAVGEGSLEGVSAGNAESETHTSPERTREMSAQLSALRTTQHSECTCKTFTDQTTHWAHYLVSAFAFTFIH